jgi:hypothetical protein
MNRNRFGLLLAITAFLLTGCHKQPPVKPAPAAQAPTIEPQPVPPLPSAATTPSQTTVQSATQESTNAANKPKPPHHPRRTKPSPIVSPPPVVAENSPTSGAEPSAPPPELQITTPAGGAEDHSRNSTEQLLESTDRNLMSIRRNLSKEEVATVQQIRAYEKDAREALKTEDLTRAHNLAIKAQLLANALVRAQ